MRTSVMLQMAAGFAFQACFRLGCKMRISSFVSALHSQAQE